MSVSTRYQQRCVSSSISAHVNGRLDCARFSNRKRSACEKFLIPPKGGSPERNEGEWARNLSSPSNSTSRSLRHYATRTTNFIVSSRLRTNLLRRRLRLTHVRFNPDNRHRWSRDERLFRAMNRRQPTPSTGQSRAIAALSIKLGKVVLDGTATNCAIISMSESCLGRTGAQHTRTSRLQAAHAPAVTTSSPRKTSRLSKIPM